MITQTASKEFAGRGFICHQEKTDFRPFEQKNIELLIATPITLAITLEAGNINETVTVETEAASPINTQNSNVGTTFTEREVKELPFLARNPVAALIRFIKTKSETQNLQKIRCNYCN